VWTRKKRDKTDLTFFSLIACLKGVNIKYWWKSRGDVAEKNLELPDDRKIG